MAFGIVLLGHFLFSTIARTQEFDALGQQTLLTDFLSVEKTFGEWELVNEMVYGGLSEGKFLIKDGEAIFMGRTKADSGGLLSFRSQSGQWESAGGHGLVLRVKGDGRTYLATIRTDQNVRKRQISWRHAFKTSPRPDEWETIVLPFHNFHPYVYKVDARRFDQDSQINPATISSIGLMIDDSSTAGFRIKIDSFSCYHLETSE